MRSRSACQRMAGSESISQSMASTARILTALAIRPSPWIHARPRSVRAGKARRYAPMTSIGSKLRKSQTEFALMIGVSVATLRNWEQGRRTPDGSALALLRVAAAEPRAVTRALRGAA
jgi:Helix-turn-helix